VRVAVGISSQWAASGDANGGDPFSHHLMVVTSVTNGTIPGQPETVRRHLIKSYFFQKDIDRPMKRR